MVSSRSKRWNGNFDALPVQYLKDVMAKMADYGDRVQFSLIGAGSEPDYQVMNSVGKAMAFDRNHHLLRPQGDEFVGVNASAVFTLDQVKSAIAGVRTVTRAAPRATRAVRASGAPTRTSAARIEEEIAERRYEYFKNNRQSLPPTITAHADEIAELMKKGQSAEDAFAATVKKYF